MEPPELQEGQESFELRVEALPDSVHVVTALEELIQNKFKLKTSVYRENDFVALYSACIQRALASVEPMSFDDLLNKHHTININEVILDKDKFKPYYGIAHYIVSSTFAIIVIEAEYYLLFPKTWDHFLLCNPSFSFSLVGWSQHIFEYFCATYPDKKAVVYHCV